MATLKAIVKSKTRNGMYNVYIRIAQNRQFAYVRTSWMVNDKGLSDDKKDIIDPFVIQQTSILIEKFYTMLNQVDASQWSANEVLTYVTDLRVIYNNAHNISTGIICKNACNIKSAILFLHQHSKYFMRRNF